MYVTYLASAGGHNFILAPLNDSWKIERAKLYKIFANLHKPYRFHEKNDLDGNRSLRWGVKPNECSSQYLSREYEVVVVELHSPVYPEKASRIS